MRYHRKALSYFQSWFLIISQLTVRKEEKVNLKPRPVVRHGLAMLFTIFITIQIILPLRHFLYTGPVHWNEEGYRWSWRVMLLEKSGMAIFTVEDPHTGRKFEVENSRFLTPYQEKQMAFQPDFILQFAHYLERYYKEKLGSQDLRITVRSQVSLNGRKSQPLIRPEADLTTIHNSWSKKEWILPYKSEITSL